jgi:lambda repressor-like predicted transcriptional regulator
VIHYVTDWEAIFDDIRRRGVVLKQLSTMTGIPLRSLNEYRAGEMAPRHDRGETIIAFWCGLTSNQRTQVPLVAGNGDTAHTRHG